MTSTETPDEVNWVGNHHEAHGQLLVRGDTLKEVLSRARAAALNGCGAACLGRCYGFADQLHARIHFGWWRIIPCSCTPRPAASNHPAWHYHRAERGEPDAWRGAEVRIHLTASGGPA